MSRLNPGIVSPSWRDRQPVSAGSFSCYIMGTESLLIQCAENLLRRGHVILGIITQESTIAAWAHEHDLRVIEPGPDLAAVLAGEPFDYFLSITNLSIIPDELLALPRRGAINFHDGPLPRYAGLYATSWALINREKSHGITWHSMASEIDQGAILKQKIIPIGPEETAFGLNVKCYEAGIETFGLLVDELATGAVQPVPQDSTEKSYFGKYTRPDAACVLDWRQSEDQLLALVRALDFGPYPNPLGLPKLIVDDRLFAVIGLAKVAPGGQMTPRPAPGTITAITKDALQIAVGDGEVRLTKLITLSGQPLGVADLAADTKLAVGDALPLLDEESAARLTKLNSRICRHEEFWVEQLANVETFELPYANHNVAPCAPFEFDVRSMLTPVRLDTVAWPDGAESDRLLAAFVAFLARTSGNYRIDLEFADDALRDRIRDFEPFFAPRLPLHVALDPAASFAANVKIVLDQLAKVKHHQTYIRDCTARFPELNSQRLTAGAALPVIVEQTAHPSGYRPAPGSELTLLLPPVDAHVHDCLWVHDTAILDRASIDSMQRQFATFLQHAAAEPQQPLAQVSVLTDAELRQLLVEWNATQTDYDQALCIHQLIERQAERTPQATAIVFEDRQMTYAQLDLRANQVAHHLQKLGVGPDVLVGVYLERSLELMVALLGILKAGGAYVPLDPTYPAERIAFMVADARLPVIVTQAELASSLPQNRAQIVEIDAGWSVIAQEKAERPQSSVTPDNLGYVIYTSGSTGKPKGVMVCHRNVVNFCAGMDQRVAHDPPGVWLAVTSLSFDISVLELFWTLARGFKVVIYADSSRERAAIGHAQPHAHKSIDFSLFYFASDESEQGVTDKYRLLLEGAKYADQHGFAAVWTPERHFHAFGGLYPNPSVASAAIAAVTQRVGIRAGSCVLPIHNPIRVVEEWSMVDNISQGRVGISFAAGWQPNDFVLRPENHADRKNIMFRDIETVRKLWSGETVYFPGPNGQDVAVSTLPRPVQDRLPIWITAAGNPETFEMAGAGGYFILTHLLGQNLEELAEKISIYRQAWHDNGYPGHGHATVMLHTFVGDDMDSVRATVRKPMMDYLRSAVGLIRNAAWTFPTFKQRADAAGKNPLEFLDTEDVSPEDWEDLLAYAFERYFETSGLFGTPESCLEMVNRLKELDADEIGCLIDFGVPSATVLTHLAHLNALKDLADPVTGAQAEKYGIASQIRRHGVTHMQCTPSMASMLMHDEASRSALSTLRAFMVGGEAFPVELAASLSRLVQGHVINMYGPTETTIWSSTYTVDHAEESVSIGRPIANTEMYILDGHLQPVPLGVAGELFIGGDGVVRGYLNRPELTAERFIQHPFRTEAGARLYRTGDLVRYRADGNIDFLGRTDHQVKIRGYRVELGEIEVLLHRHPAIREAVVVAREDTPDNKQLVAYLIFGHGHSASNVELRDALRNQLPEFMIPSAFVPLKAFPLTPNGKVDRRGLPAPDESRLDGGHVYVAPRTVVEAVLCKVFANIVGVNQVGIRDSFFELGGHSLLAVQLISQLRDAFMTQLPLHSLFDAPTVAGLAEALVAHETKPGQTETIARILKQVDDMSADEVSAALDSRNPTAQTEGFMAEGSKA